MEKPENLKTPFKENRSIIWKGVRFRVFLLSKTRHEYFFHALADQSPVCDFEFCYVQNCGVVI